MRMIITAAATALIIISFKLRRVTNEKFNLDELIDELKQTMVARIIIDQFFIRFSRETVKPSVFFPSEKFKRRIAKSTVLRS